MYHITEAGLAYVLASLLGNSQAAYQGLLSGYRSLTLTCFGGMQAQGNSFTCGW
jgi:hypothetical protein